MILSLCKSVDKQIWSFDHPLAQFDLPYAIVEKLNLATKNMSIEEMRDLDVKTIGEMIRFNKMGTTIKKCLQQFPQLDMDAVVAPITPTVLRVTLYITPSIYNV